MWNGWQVVDHEETELAKQLSKLNGEVRYVDTAQGFRLTEVISFYVNVFCFCSHSDQLH